MSAATGLARSLQVRLARHARAIGADPNLVLARYATERFLYRLSCSPYVERFVLKGALLLLGMARRDVSAHAGRRPAGGW